MDNFNDVSYFKVPNDEECILNAVAVGKLIDESASTVRLWGDMYEEFLYIKKINGRLTYTQASVLQFKFIKELIREKKFTHKQIYDHISKLGFSYAKYDGGIVNPEDPLGFQALSASLSLETQKVLKQFLYDFVKYQDNFKDSLRQELKEDLSISVEEIVSNKLDDKFEDFKTYIDQKELNFKEHDAKIIDTLRTGMRDAELKNENESKKGFWSRIFNKNK